MKHGWECKTAPNGGHGLEFSGKLYYLGTFTHKERAAMADDRAPVALCGEYAGLKFQKGNIGRKIPQDDSRRYGRNLFWKLQEGGPG